MIRFFLLKFFARVGRCWVTEDREGELDCLTGGIFSCHDLRVDPRNLSNCLRERSLVFLICGWEEIFVIYSTLLLHPRKCTLKTIYTRYSKG
jgi:hypothetical protein